MRTGANFARGSCRALKWMALLGVVFALGASTATAQIIVETEPDGVEVTVSETVTEGGTGTIVVKVTANIAEGANATDVTVMIGTLEKAVTADPPVTNELGDIALSRGEATISFPAGNLDDDKADTELVMEDVVRTVTIPFGAGQDNDEAEDEIAYFTVVLSEGVDRTNAALDGPFKVIIEDDETQEILLTEVDEGDATESATPIKLTMKPKFAFVDDDITVVLTHDADAGDFELSLFSEVFNVDTSGPVLLTLTGPANDGNRVTDTVTVSLTLDDPSAEAEALEVKIADAHMLPYVTVTVTDADDEEATELMEGEDYTLTVMLVDDEGEEASSDAEDLEVMLSLAAASEADASDYRLQPSTMAEISQGESSGTLTLLVLENSDIDPETLVLDAQVSGDSDFGPAGPSMPGVVNLSIGDSTVPTVTPKLQTEIEKAYMDAREVAAGGGDMPWRAGDDPLTIDLDMLFNLPVTGSYDADATSADATIVVADADADVSATGGGTVTVTPMGTGMAEVHVTVSTGTASVTMQLTATSAQATFKAMVDAPPPPPVTRGQITLMELTGGVTEKNIGGRTRFHVTEGATDVELEMTVQWTHAEITALYGARSTAADAVVDVEVYGSTLSGGLPNWVSWIDAEQDVHFPNSRVGSEGNLVGRVSIEIPDRPRSNEFPYSVREVRSSTGVLSVLILEDNSEAENDAFYIRAKSSDDVDLNAGSAVHWTTLMTVIEDNEEQTVTVTYGTPPSKGPTSVYENADTNFEITAFPPRVDLPLDVRLDMLDLSGVTVSAAKISLNTASATLNADRSGTPASNTRSVRVHLPASDGDRENDEYDLQASVNVYSLAAGGFEAIKAAYHRVNVIDIHKLPWLSVSPLAATVMEGNEIELTLTVNRNPANTIATNPETRQYTSEVLSIAVMPTPSGGNYTVPMTVTVPAHNKRAPWTQEVMVTFEAGEDEDVDPDMAQTLDFVVNGTVAANGPRPDGDTNSMAQAVLTIQDATTTLVSVRENAYDVIKGALGEPPMVGVGMSGMLMGVNLFDYDADAVSVVYATSVEGGAVTASVSDGTVTVMGVSAGEAKVTITATATPNASSLVVNQTKSNVAQLTFPVMVSTPVPALPVIAQLLLAAFLGLGGFRRYLRRR